MRHARPIRTTLIAALALALTPTLAQAASPTATTNGTSAITTTAGTLHGTINPHGLPTTYSFQWGATTAYGAATPDKSAGAGSGGKSVTARIHGLTPGIRYHYRVVATNADGTTQGADHSFKTALPPVKPPAVLSSSPFSPGATSVNLTALIDPDSAATSYRFQWGATTTYGLETFAQTVPAGAVPVSVRIPVTGLASHTTYHARVVASNRGGTTVGPDFTFTTGPFPPAKLSIGTRPHRQRLAHPFFIVSGVLTLPNGVSVDEGCGGAVGIRFTAGKRVMAYKHVGFAHGHCSFRVRMKARPRPGKHLLRVRVHFGGNAILTPFDAHSFLVRFH